MAKFLVNNGICYGEGGISRTTTGTYYLCESKKCMSLVQKYKDKNSCIN